MPPASKNRNKKLMIYAGVAGAVVALIVILKKRSATSSESSSTEGGPTYASAPSSIPASGETTQGELARFEQALSGQLPGAISEGVKAGLENNKTSQQPGQPTLSELLGFITSIQSSRTGEQTGAAAASPSSGAPSVTYNIAPAAPPPAAAAAPSAPVIVSHSPQPPSSGSSFSIIRCGNGCEGHRHTNGQVDCQVKDSKGRCHW